MDPWTNKSVTVKPIWSWDVDSITLKPPKAYSMPTFKTIEYRIESILEKIQSDQELSDADISEIVKNQYKMLLDPDLFNKSPKASECARSLFSNERFLKAFIDQYRFLSLTNEEKHTICTLAYDYYVYKEKDPKISELLLQLGYLINPDLVIKLSANTTISNSRILAILRYSSTNIGKCVKRVNKFLVDLNLTMQQIVNIYIILFENFSPLFSYTILGSNSDSPGEYDKFVKAVLIILESMDNNNIISVISNYLGTIYHETSIDGKQFNARCLLKDIYKDNNRMIYLINYALNNNGGLYQFDYI